MSDNDDVRALHEKFGLMSHGTPGLITQAKLKERVEFLLEELTELAEAGGLSINVDTRLRACGCAESFNPDCSAHKPLCEVRVATLGAQDLALQADALVDLIYVAHGTAVMLGLPMDVLWKDVHRANMAKVRGMTKRGHRVDLAKPEGWVGPKTEEILRDAGYVPGAEAARDDSTYLAKEEVGAAGIFIPNGYLTEDILNALKDVKYTKLQVWEKHPPLSSKESDQESAYDPNRSS